MIKCFWIFISMYYPKQIFNDMNFLQIFNHTSKPLPAYIVYFCKNQIIAKNGDKKENRKY